MGLILQGVEYVGPSQQSTYFKYTNSPNDVNKTTHMLQVKHFDGLGPSCLACFRIEPYVFNVCRIGTQLATWHFYSHFPEMFLTPQRIVEVLKIDLASNKDQKGIFNF